MLGDGLVHDGMGASHVLEAMQARPFICCAAGLLQPVSCTERGSGAELSTLLNVAWLESSLTDASSVQEELEVGGAPI